MAHYDEEEQRNLDAEFTYGKKQPRGGGGKDAAIYGMWAEQDGAVRRSQGGSGSLGGSINFVSSDILEAETKNDHEENKSTVQPATSVGPSASETTASGRWSRRAREARQQNAPKKAKLTPTNNSQPNTIATKKPTAKTTLKLDAEFGQWEKHTNGFGLKMLKKMGFKGRLGKNETGRHKPVTQKLRPRGIGLAYKNFKERNESLDYRNAAEEDAMTAQQEQQKKQRHAILVPRTDNWKRGKPKIKRVYKTAADIEAEADAERSTASAPQVVVDMRGPTVRITSLGSIRSESNNSNSDSWAGPTRQSLNNALPELEHNVRVLLDLTKEDIQKTARELRATEDSVVSIRHERDRLAVCVTRDTDNIDRVGAMLRLLDETKARLAGVTKQGNLLTAKLDIIAECVDVLVHTYSTEWVALDMADVVEALAFPVFRGLLHQWEPLLPLPQQGPSSQQLLPTLHKWKTLLANDQRARKASKPKRERKQVDHSDMYRRLINELLLPRLRTVVTGQWQPKEKSYLVETMAQLRSMMPHDIFSVTTTQLILPKLKHTADQWNPRVDTVPVHSWVQCWLPLLTDEPVQPLFQVIRYKLAVVLQQWNPADASALTVIRPWQKVWRANDLDNFLMRCIVPKLQDTLRRHFTVNPQHQQVEPFQLVIQWAPILSPKLMLRLLAMEFFPKWFTALWHWLRAGPDFEEVSKWYLGWKSMFPTSLKDEAQIKAFFNQGLDLMNLAVSDEALEPLYQRIMVALQTGQTLQQPTILPTPSSPSPAPAPRAVRVVEDDVRLSLKEVIQKLADMHAVAFVPNFKRGRKDGKQIYMFGQLSLYLDMRVIYVYRQGEWRPTSLQELILIQSSSS